MALARAWAKALPRAVWALTPTTSQKLKTLPECPKDPANTSTATPVSLNPPQQPHGRPWAGCTLRPLARPPPPCPTPGLPRLPSRLCILTRRGRQRPPPAWSREGRTCRRQAPVQEPTGCPADSTLGDLSEATGQGAPPVPNTQVPGGHRELSFLPRQPHPGDRGESGPPDAELTLVTPAHRPCPARPACWHGEHQGGAGEGQSGPTALQALASPPRPTGLRPFPGQDTAPRTHLGTSLPTLP